MTRSLDGMRLQKVTPVAYGSVPIVPAAEGSGTQWGYSWVTLSWARYRPSMTVVSDWYIPYHMAHLPTWIRPT